VTIYPERPTAFTPIIPHHLSPRSGRRWAGSVMLEWFRISQRRLNRGMAGPAASRLSGSSDAGPNRSIPCMDTGLRRHEGFPEATTSGGLDTSVVHSHLGWIQGHSARRARAHGANTPSGPPRPAFTRLRNQKRHCDGRQPWCRQHDGVDDALGGSVWYEVRGAPQATQNHKTLAENA